MDNITTDVRQAYNALVDYTETLALLPLDCAARDPERKYSYLCADLSIPELEALCQLGHSHVSSLRKRGQAMAGRRGVRSVRRAAATAERLAAGCTDQAYFSWAYASPDERARRMQPRSAPASGRDNATEGS